MKRTVAFLAAVCVSTGLVLATSALAQDSPPPPPTDAAGDTVKTNQLAAPPTTPAATPAAQDTAAAGARTRRMKTAESQRSYIFSLGVGTGVEYKPEIMTENYSPAFGAMMAFGVRQHGVTLAAHFGYNFFLVSGTVPNDLNILTIFLDVRYTPVHTKARPYILVCGGYWSQWVVDLDYDEDVLGYGGGAGVEIEIDRTKRLFLDVRYIEGQTRKYQDGINVDESNTVIIPGRLGVTWEFR